MAILASTDYASIRRAIDVTLTPGLAPDAAIRDPFVLPAAEADAVTRYPFAADMPSLEPAVAQSVKSATILLAAARLLPRLPRVTSESWDDHRATFDIEDTDVVVARLTAEAAAILSGLPGSPTYPTTTTSSHSRFRLARARRCS